MESHLQGQILDPALSPEDWWRLPAKPQPELLPLYFPPNEDGTPVWVDTSPLIVSDGVMLILDSAGILHAYIEPACQVYLPIVGK